jgi:hypothetical protein
MILKYKIHYKFYCLVYFIMIYLLYTDTRLGRLCITTPIRKHAPNISAITIYWIQYTNCFTLCTLHTCKILWNMKGIVHLLSIFKIHVVIGGNCTSATFWFCDLLVAGLLHMNRFWRGVGAIVIMSCVGHNHVFDMW